MPQEFSITDVLLDQINSVYDGKAWHGPTLRGSLRGIHAREAGTIKTPGGHSIAEIAMHCTYWKYSVRRRLLKSPKGSFRWKGSNWFTVSPKLQEEEWKCILATLDEEHSALASAVQSFPSSQLTHVPKGSKYTFFQLIQGIAAHDVFHAGQVRLLKPKVE